MKTHQDRDRMGFSSLDICSRDTLGTADLWTVSNRATSLGKLTKDIKCNINEGSMLTSFCRNLNLWWILFWDLSTSNSWWPCQTQDRMISCDEHQAFLQNVVSGVSHPGFLSHTNSRLAPAKTNGSTTTRTTCMFLHKYQNKSMNINWTYINRTVTLWNRLKPLFPRMHKYVVHANSSVCDNTTGY